MIKQRILRGRLPKGTIQEVIVDDGNFRDGWTVEEFVVVGADTSQGFSVTGTLSLTADGASEDWDFNNPKQIGWSGSAGDSTQVRAHDFGNYLIDERHIVLRSLFIRVDNAGTTGNTEVNYYIKLKARSVSPQESVVAILNEVK